MQKTGKIVAVGIFVLVIVFGVGQFFAFAPNPDQTSTSNEPTTQILRYAPPAQTAQMPTAEGSCWTNSIAAPYRADAWRCTTGNAVSDPCFSLPNNKTVLCGIDPINPASSSTFVLKLTKPLPAPQAFTGPVPSNWAWLAELKGGTLCSPFTGTRPFTADGQAANYGCAPGPLGKDVLIFGDFDTSTPAWVANVGTLTAATSSLPTIATSEKVPVSAVWQ